MIYFIQDSSSHAIKIGTSKNPLARLLDLQTAHHARLLLIGVMDGMRSEEQALHKKFHRLQGEWFEPTPELLEYIHEHALSLSSLSRPLGMPALSVDMPLIRRIYIIRDIVLLVLSWLVVAFSMVCGSYFFAKWVLDPAFEIHFGLAVAPFLTALLYVFASERIARRIARKASTRSPATFASDSR